MRDYNKQNIETRRLMPLRNNIDVRKMYDMVEGTHRLVDCTSTAYNTRLFLAQRRSTVRTGTPAERTFQRQNAAAGYRAVRASDQWRSNGRVGIRDRGQNWSRAM